MKKCYFIMICLFVQFTGIRAQGLENVIVEKYYISEANDTTVNSVGGVLPVGSVTYRIFLDMLPDYIFQSAYGDPNHECRIETTTLFFNNEDRGAVHPTFNFNYCDDNTVMLDSWLSVGAACAGRMGVLKAEDDGVGTVSNTDGVLQNDTSAIIPLTDQDGLILGTPEPVVTVGIGTEIMVFDSQNDGTNGPVFSTFNGAWASLNGSMGPDPVSNKVLIAQITTDGDFSFSLNVQIRNQITFGVENYVADNPIGNEILFPALNYNSLTSAVSESNQKLSFGVYPNPAGAFTTVAYSVTRTSEQAVVAVYDLLGNLVLSEELGTLSGSGQYHLNLANLVPGMYFVTLRAGDQIQSRRIVKI